MSGIVFLNTADLPLVREFYTGTIGCVEWLDQGDCLILRQGNQLIGFCGRGRIQADVLLTFFYEERAEIDRMYESLSECAEAAPGYNEAYRIYRFFARDPEGRRLEFQYFDHELSPHLSGEELLLRRRSVRRFQPHDVSDATIERVIELSRWAPTARNTQCYYFKVIRDHATLDWLAGWRGTSSAPIGRAPVAVAIGADPAVSRRHIQDGCIAAYHFLLAARLCGLGTCWIAAADDAPIKARLGIPVEHYLVTVTPLGWPESYEIAAPERKARSWFTRA